VITAITLFCDDAREEASGAMTLVGIAPDNINVPQLPGALAKLAIYTRIAVPTHMEPVALEVFLRSPQGDEVPMGSFAANFVESTCAEARAAGNPVAGFVTTATAIPFAIPAPGRWTAFLRAAEVEIITGTVNFGVQPDA
jgi:hypothetical protein